MKKIITLIIAVCYCFLLFGCNKIEYYDQIEELYVGDSYTIGEDVYELNTENFKFEIDNPDLVTISDITIVTKKAGVCTIKTFDKSKNKLLFTTTITIKDIEITSPDKVLINETISLVINSNKNATWEVKDSSIASIEGDKLRGLKLGETVIKAIVNGIEIEKTITVYTNNQPIIISNIEDSITIEEKGEVEFSATVEPQEFELIIINNNEDIITIEDNKIKALKAGNASITLKVKNENANKEINVKVLKNESPKFSFDENYKKEITLNYGKELDPTVGLKVVDNVDGDITDKVVLKEQFNNTEYGKRNITLEVKDSVGNVITLERTVNVVWNYSVMFIGHAGSYYGLMNSEEAFLYAVQKLHYQALECDLKQTSDGVFVLSHDNDFNGYDIATTSWEVLKNVEKTASRKAGIPGSNGSVTNSPYTTKLCTLERYLEICKQYNAKAVIELKSSKGITNSDQSRMSALMQEIEKCGMRENVIFLGSQYNCLIWTRQNGYEDIECQYLVNSCESETYLQRCKDYDLDISINVTGDSSISNSEEWLARYHEAGLKISTYTYSQYVDYDVVQEWINKGVDYVTCDWHIIEKLNLPENSFEPVSEFTVTFKDIDG